MRKAESMWLKTNVNISTFIKEWYFEFTVHHLLYTLGFFYFFISYKIKIILF